MDESARDFMQIFSSKLVEPLFPYGQPKAYTAQVMLFAIDVKWGRERQDCEQLYFIGCDLGCNVMIYVF